MKKKTKNTPGLPTSVIKNETLRRQKERQDRRSLDLVRNTFKPRLSIEEQFQNRQDEYLIKLMGITDEQYLNKETPWDDKQKERAAKYDYVKEGMYNSIANDKRDEILDFKGAAYPKAPTDGQTIIDRYEMAKSHGMLKGKNPETYAMPANERRKSENALASYALDEHIYNQQKSAFGNQTFEEFWNQKGKDAISVISDNLNNVTEMKKNKYQKMGMGGQVFDVASDLLIGGTMNAVTNMFRDIQNPEHESRLTTKNTGFVMANGGQVPVEVEGGETFHSPNGQMGEFQGPKHEAGGIPTELPQGTKVFSDRLKLEGKTMAERKKNRENKVNRLTKLLEANSSDALIKNSLKRTQAINGLEEQQDMDIQEGVNFLQGNLESVKMALGGYVSGLPKLANGTPPQGVGDGDIYNPTSTHPNIYYRNSGDSWYTYDAKNPKDDWKIVDPKHSAIPQLNSWKGKQDKMYFQSNPEFMKEFEGMTTAPLGEIPVNNFMPNLGTNILTNPEQQLSNKIPNNTGFPTKRAYSVTDPNAVTTLNPNERFEGTEMVDGKMMPIIGQKGVANLSPMPGIKTIGNDPFDTQNIQDMASMGESLTTPNEGSSSNKLKDLIKKLQGSLGGQGQGEDGELPLTRGDAMGLAGNFQDKFGPLATTLLNKMQTPANVNMFKEYGTEGLRAMQEAQALASINRDKQLGDIQLAENTSRSRNRNTARGVNTMRSLDIAADMGATEAQGNAYNQYAQQMMQLLGQKGQMENQQDSMVMQGEQQRDLADRQDVDNFYTNLSQNVANMSEFTQKTGRDLNQSQYNKDVMSMMQYLSKYGVAPVYKNGKLVLEHKGNKVWTEEEKKAKKAEAKNKATIEANNSGTTYTE